MDRRQVHDVEAELRDVREDLAPHSRSPPNDRGNSSYQAHAAASGRSTSSSSSAIARGVRLSGWRCIVSASAALVATATRSATGASRAAASPASAPRARRAARLPAARRGRRRPPRTCARGRAATSRTHRPTRSPCSDGVPSRSSRSSPHHVSLPCGAARSRASRSRRAAGAAAARAAHRGRRRRCPLRSRRPRRRRASPGSGRRRSRAAPRAPPRAPGALVEDPCAYAASRKT